MMLGGVNQVSVSAWLEWWPPIPLFSVMETSGKEIGLLGPNCDSGEDRMAGLEACDVRILRTCACLTFSPDFFEIRADDLSAG